ncbi:MAG: hypothetical protein EXR95_07045 [Gemmatimonadetes bacterium]|nr:hypothetical protein [Gemmatimonadota bacterium]
MILFAQADVLVRDEGTIVVLTPRTPAALDWFKEHVKSEPWQWLGGGVAVDRRFAGSLVEVARLEGLTVGSFC